MAECTIDSPNVQAFLKLVRFAEHYPDTSDNFYDTLYGGGRFSGYATHPNRSITRWGHTSNAAGAYQILYSTWAEEHRRGVAIDFSPASQDAIAFDKLRSRGALPAACAGDLPTAFNLLRSEWTALPGAAQTRMTLEAGTAAFTGYGGTLK